MTLCSTAYAQPASAETKLVAGITQFQTGDFLRALFPLNEVLTQLAGDPTASGCSHTLTRIAPPPTSG